MAQQRRLIAFNQFAAATRAAAPSAIIASYGAGKMAPVTHFYGKPTIRQSADARLAHGSLSVWSLTTV